MTTEERLASLKYFLTNFTAVKLPWEFKVDGNMVIAELPYWNSCVEVNINEFGHMAFTTWKDGMADSYLDLKYPKHETVLRDLLMTVKAARGLTKRISNNTEKTTKWSLLNNALYYLEDPKPANVTWNMGKATEALRKLETLLRKERQQRQDERKQQSWESK